MSFNCAITMYFIYFSTAQSAVVLLTLITHLSLSHQLWKTVINLELNKCSNLSNAQLRNLLGMRSDAYTHAHGVDIGGEGGEGGSWGGVR